MQVWEPLRDDEITAVHEAACRMLDELGMRIREPRAVDILVGAGARRVDEQTVKIPRAVVERAIADVPPVFSVYDRRGNELVIGDESHHHMNLGTVTEMLDYPSLRRREATCQDLRHATVLIDALDSIDMAIPIVEPRDVAPGAGEIVSCAELLKHTSQFCFACPVEHRANEAFVSMGKALAGVDDLAPRPTIGLLASMVPGYEIDAEAAKALMIAAREGLPVILMGGGIMGAQSPATMAGTLVMGVAEQLAGLCLVQALRPGSPCLWSIGMLKLDMRIAEIEECGPEYLLSVGAGAQIARRYGIPSYATPGSDSKIADLQAGFEMAAGLQACLHAGVHVSVNAGAASKCSACSLELLVLHNEMLRSLLRVHRGMTVNPDTLAVEAMKEVGIRGDYLSTPDTIRWIRHSDEYLGKDLFDCAGIRSEYRDPCAGAQALWQRVVAEHEPDVSTEERAAVDAVASEYLPS
jgi:trimethylamine--corrinoid protein Co-methyltransferase